MRSNIKVFEAIHEDNVSIAPVDFIGCIACPAKKFATLNSNLTRSFSIIHPWNSQEGWKTRGFWIAASNGTQKYRKDTIV